MTDVASARGTGLWRCACTYLNVDSPKCDMCGKPAPAAAPAISLPKPNAAEMSELRALWEEVHAGEVREARPIIDEPRADPRGARRTVVRIILLNLVYQAVLVGTMLGMHLRSRDAIEFSLAAGILFYGVIAIWVGFRSFDLGVEAKWLIGGRGRALTEGLALGGAAAIVVSVGIRLLTGQTGDPVTAALANENIGILILGAFVIAVVAPVIEEIVFRGFLAEALRVNGTALALVTSSVAFAFAHLRIIQLPYYTALGFGLGVLYLRRGLTGSIAAHAGFNGSLIVVAVLALHGPAVTYHADGLALRLPATWHKVASGADLRLDGPGGAEILVTHREFPSTVSLNLGRLRAAIAAGAADHDGETVDRSTVRIDQLPIGPALRFQAQINGHEDDVTAIILGSKAISVEVVPEGSDRAAHDTERMLTTLNADGSHHVP